MADSEDEGQELVSDSVSEYEFLYNNELVSFAELPVVWNGEKTGFGNSKRIFLSGKIDNGLRKVYTEVVAWKFDLSCDKRKPEVSVLSVDGKWLKLLKPRSRFQVIGRAVQISVSFLHFCKWNAQGSERDLWDHLDHVFSMFEKSPSEEDLRCHLDLIKEAVKRDETLANSKVFTTFIQEKGSIRKVVDEDVRPPFIVDEPDEDEYETNSADMDDPSSQSNESEDGDESTDEKDIYDTVCSICDNGGDILICDGKCLRSFHPTIEDGTDSYCETLGFTKEECEALDTWLCNNCKFKRHQCYVCGNLGSSDESTNPEVFCCVNGACGYFYHPFCVAKLLHPGDDTEAKEHAQRISLGEKFACPAHRCHVCKELEVRKDHELQFAVCRRCPRVYHRKCLPREIAFEQDVMEDPYIVQRAWEKLIPDRILIYCLEHEINPEVLTPARNHLKFPGPQRKAGNMFRDVINERATASEDAVRKRVLLRQPESKKVSYYSKQGDIVEKTVENRELGSARNKNMDVNKKYLHKKDFSGTDEEKTSLGDKLFDKFFSVDSQDKVSSRAKNAMGPNEMTNKVNFSTKSSNDSDALDNNEKIRILKLIKDASHSITLDTVKKQHKAPSTHSQYLHNVDAITVGKLDGVMQALYAALRKLEDGGSIMDAKAICPDDILFQVQRWRDKLKVYLAPFLYGPRYTSFGRHFTKVDKLQKIVDILHWYVEEGDMVVDFCCGSNDFNSLMKAKLDDTGKKASFKNYDIVQPRNDFNFERRDWMHVRTDELPSGSQLIMGLNPPFGVNAALANKFINKALTFKPKLMILIIPRETERLDKKYFAYDLIWEDDRMLSGKSFYLPGCVDGNEKQVEDWNTITPVLSLWSHPDFTQKHMFVAEQHDHPYGFGNKDRAGGDGENIHNISSEGFRDPDEGFVGQGGDMAPVKLGKQETKPEKQEMKPEVQTEQQGPLTEGSTRVVGEKSESQKTDSENKSSNFHGNNKRALQSVDNPRYSKTPRQFSGIQHRSPHVTDHLKPEKYSTGHLNSPRPGPYSQIIDQKFDYRSFTKFDIPGFDAETADVVSRYHNSAGASNNSLWMDHPERRPYAIDASLHSNTYVHRTEVCGPWTPGHVQTAFPAPRIPSYPVQPELEYRPPSSVQQLCVQDPVGLRYNPVPPPATNARSLRYVPGAYPPFLP